MATDQNNQKEERKMTFQEELTALLNRHSMENRSDTPDFILAEYMLASLHAFEKATVDRTNWYGAHFVRVPDGEQKASPEPRDGD